MRKQKDGFHIHVHEAVELRLLDLQHRAAGVTHAGIVDQDIDAAESIDGGLYRRVHVPAPGDVAMSCDGRVADGGGYRLRRGLVDVGDCDARTLAREGLGNALAEPRCAAGDERNLILKPHAFVSTPLSHGEA